MALTSAQGILYNTFKINAEVQMERIRQLRKERGFSQAKLAVMADMDPATLNRLERGTGNPNLKTLERVAEALGVEVADFFPKAQRRSSLEPTLLNGLEDERRIVIDYASCRDALNEFCVHWEGELKAGQLTHRSFQDFEATAKSLSKLMRQLMGAEMAELGPEEDSGEPTFYSERSVLWSAIDRFIVLGIQMDRLGKERFGEDLTSEADVIQLREYAQKKAG
jgi:transcriptional regulator with XRE-family HTH domain